MPIATRSGSVPCWTYFTEGLAAYGQKEIVFSLRLEKGDRPDDIPELPLHLFATIFQYARKGQLVDAGGVSQFGDKKFFGRHLVYLPTRPLAGLPLPENSLTALLVTEEELAAVRAFGITRLVARLGEKARHYPCPPWSERKRSGLPLGKVMEESILNHIPLFHLPGATVTREGPLVLGQEERLVLRLSSNARQIAREILEQPPANAGCAFLTYLDEEANACLSWEPEQQGPTVILPEGSDGSRMGGCFVAFVPEQEASQMAITEDGYSLLLTDSDWTEIKQAIGSEGTGAISLKGQLLLVIEPA